MTNETPLTLAVLVFPQFPMMAFSSVIEPLRAANVLAKRQCYHWFIVGADDRPVEASNGVVIKPGFSAHSAPRADRIVVCSGGDADHLVADGAVAWIRKSLRGGAHIGAVADGAFFLARAGLLDGHACTLHWTSQAAFAEAFPTIDLKRDLYIIDRKRFTSAGGVGSLDMMLDIITADYGAGLAAGVAEWFVHSPLRSSVDRKMMPLRLRTGVQNELVLSAIAIMEDDVEERLAMSDLATRLGVSPDRLERCFRAELSISPNGYYRRLRLKRAADLLAHSSMAVRDVALACGFSSMSSFARAFREEHGHPPRLARRH
ncbi:GlxA family transcriptional regulator [Mesorhizobium sp. BAC0120]|uniref:GlxA family transcriptional regulator n=1 Tax=Mesorhizobium sp. BAC0120 TaxID=3090670 RepID=UPI00298C09F6|nr:GlxA family transcriptional regulator [Mesorhizobium sp. BAC0120]MDW6026177.1 GlxA family transcriptional regulator [Mesorhizobium sp. BAC0120]